MLAAAIAGPPSIASAQELEPRFYLNIPVGLNFLLGGYGYTTGGATGDPAVPLSDAELSLDSGFVAYARSFSVLGQSAKIDALLPYSSLSGDATFAGESRERNVSGFHDPRLRFTWNFYGAPALTMEEFESYEQDLVVGASLQVQAPLGQYDSSKLVNLGTNRWFIKPELGISKTWGPVTIELAPSVTFFTDNDDFLNGNEREQDPLYALQGHLIYNLGRGMWVALNSTIYGGGTSTVNGIENDDRQESWRVGATFSMPVSRRHSIKIYGSTGIAVRTGGDFDAVGIAWQYRWGDGL